MNRMENSRMNLIREFLVRVTGLEPARGKHQILSLARLPIPPHPRDARDILAHVC